MLTFIALAFARGHGRLPEDLAVVLFRVLLVGWVVLPILTFGSDDLLDPARLALLPLNGAEFVIVMGVGALVGVAPVVAKWATTEPFGAIGTDLTLEAASIVVFWAGTVPGTLQIASTEAPANKVVRCAISAVSGAAPGLKT